MSENEGAEATEVEDAADGNTTDPDATTDTATGGDEQAAEETVEPDEELVERVAAADPEQVAGEIVALRERADEAERALAEREKRIADLEERVDDLESRLKRKQADFQNYKKRMEKRREQERERATEDLVERLLDVRDNLQRALDQEEDADIRDGVEATLRQFDQVLDRENVERVEPEPGEEVDPLRHEVLMRVEADHPAGTVARVHRPGYEMADKVLRPAQVTVSEGADDGEAESESEREDEADAEEENEDE